MPVAASAFLRDRDVFGSLELEDAEMQVASHQRHLEHAVVERRMVSCGTTATWPRQLATGKARSERPFSVDGAWSGRSQAAQSSRSSCRTRWTEEGRSAADAERRRTRRGLRRPPRRACLNETCSAVSDIVSCRRPSRRKGDRRRSRCPGSSGSSAFALRASARLTVAGPRGHRTHFPVHPAVSI